MGCHQVAARGAVRLKILLHQLSTGGFKAALSALTGPVIQPLRDLVMNKILAALIAAAFSFGAYAQTPAAAPMAPMAPAAATEAAAPAATEAATPKAKARKVAGKTKKAKARKAGKKAAAVDKAA